MKQTDKEAALIQKLSNIEYIVKKVHGIQCANERSAAARSACAFIAGYLSCNLDLMPPTDSVIRNFDEILERSKD